MWGVPGWERSSDVAGVNKRFRRRLGYVRASPLVKFAYLGATIPLVTEI